MNGLFAGVGCVDMPSVRQNGGGYTCMFRIGSDRYYLAGLADKPQAGELFVLGTLYSFRGRECGQLHVGVRPMAVFPVDQVSPAMISSVISQWMSAAVGY